MKKPFFDSLKISIWLEEIFITLSANPINRLSVSKWLQLDSCPSERFSENPRVLYKIENYYQIATGKKLSDHDKSRGLVCVWGECPELKGYTNQSSAYKVLFKIIIYRGPGEGVCVGWRVGKNPKRKTSLLVTKVELFYKEVVWYVFC